jgi:hypothetical protein
MEFDFDEMLRKMCRDDILRHDSERSLCDRDSETYKALSAMIERLQESLAYLRNRPTERSTSAGPNHHLHTET